MRKKLFLSVLLLALVLPLKAQFFMTGDDPGYLRWYSIDTPYYRIIYPEGADSLALNYGRLLERYRPAIGNTIGFSVGENQKRMPVVLHTHNPVSNGSVAWAPKRMDIYTLPDAYGSDPGPWDIQLTTHEPRHQAQLELDRHGFWRPMSYIIGQIWSPAVFELYLSRCLAEGDAVTAETGLAAGTRARTADFLNYYQVSLDAGEYRNWYRWRYGSYKHYTPSYYAVGYITMAGARALYDDPFILSKALDKSRRNRFMFSTLNVRKTIKDHSGQNFKQTFPQILDSFNEVWQASAASRAPFIPMYQVSKEEGFSLDYSTPVLLDGKIYLLRSGYLQAPEFGEWLDGGFKRIRSFASRTSALFPDPNTGRIYWSETIYHPRWSLDGKSIIRYYDTITEKTYDLTSEGRLYNPQPSPDGSCLAVVNYPLNGGSVVEVLSADNGEVLWRSIAPDGIQASEAAWIGETLYVTGISEAGYGLYVIGPNGEWQTELEPSIQKVVRLGSRGDKLQWVSDLNGVNELYRYTPSSRELVRLTSTRFGATDFCESGSLLYGVTQTLGGKMLFVTPVDSLKAIPANYTKAHVYPIEDKITAQEQSLIKGPEAPFEASAPKKYSKLGHLMHFHSWAPIYVNYNSIESASSDILFNEVAPGVTGYFQNTLGTMTGHVGYAFKPENSSDIFGSVWRHTLHANLKYTGLFPVFEGEVHFGESMTQKMFIAQLGDGSVTQYIPAAMPTETPLVSGLLKAYIPLSWSKGGKLFGFIPQVTYNITNLLFDNAEYYFHIENPGTEQEKTVFDGSTAAQLSPMQRMLISARGYAMAPRARSQVYPRWGIGLEAGYSFRPAMEHIYRPNAFAYMYAYLPGFARTQGFKITGTFQQQIHVGGSYFNTGELMANTLPRGFSSPSSANVGKLYPSQFKATVDYAIPIYVGDIALPPIAYIRNFLVVPHADFSYFGQSANLWCAGADITAEFGKLIAPFDGSIGVSVSYLGGSIFDKIEQPRRWSVGLIMSYDF